MHYTIDYGLKTQRQQQVRRGDGRLVLVANTLFVEEARPRCFSLHAGPLEVECSSGPVNSTISVTSCAARFRCAFYYAYACTMNPQKCEFACAQIHRLSVVVATNSGSSGPRFYNALKIVKGMHFTRPLESF